MIIAPVARSKQPSQVTRPPPLLGWNARDNVAAMKDGYALWLENLIPRTEGLVLREGKERWRMLSGPVLTLMTWAGTNKASRLFAATQSTIVDVTLPNASNTAAVSGLAGGVWSWDMMSNAGGHWLICCNGANGVRLYDGAAWSTADITGVDETTFTAMVVHQSRAFFIKRNSLDLYYLDVGAIQGEAKLLPLGGVVRKGGTLVAVASMSGDGGRNSNDQLVAVTSEGEMIVYAGTSPHRAAEWSLAGVFTVPKPVGRRCFVQQGGGLAYLSTKGVLSVPSILAKSEKDKGTAAITDLVSGAYEPAVAAAPNATQAWGAIESSHHELLIINVPTQGGSKQFVQSSDGGWCLFSNFNALAWANLGDELFFGDSSGTVWRYGGTREGPDYYASIGIGASITGAGATGMADEINTEMGLVTAPIHALMIDGYAKLGTPARKSLKRCRPLLDTPASARFRFESVADHRRLPLEYINGVAYTDSRRLWESIAWTSGPTAWEGRDVSVSNQWRSVSGRGHALGLVMAVKALAPMTYAGADIIFEAGGGI